MKRLPAALALLVACGVFLLVAACTSDDEPPSADQDAVDTEATNSPEDSIALEREMEQSTPPEQFNFSQELRITDAGPVPSTIVVIVDNELTITNETDTEQTLTFFSTIDDSDSRTIGPIAAGGSATYFPRRPVSLAYSLDGGEEVDGSVQIDVGDFGG